MERNKFFKWVWRLDGLLIFVVAISLAFLMLTEAYRKLTWEAPKQEVIVSVAEDPEGKEKWVLGTPVDSVRNMVILPLVSENKEAKESTMGMVSKSGWRNYNQWRSTAKNILFIDSVTNKSFWLFDDVDRIIIDIEAFRDRAFDPPMSAHPKTVALFFQIVTKDSNDDHILNFEDKRSLAVANPDGSNYQIIIEKFDKIISKSLVDKDKIFIVFQNAGIGYSLQFQLNTFKVLSKNELPKIKIKKQD